MLRSYSRTVPAYTECDTVCYSVNGNMQWGPIVIVHPVCVSNLLKNVALTLSSYHPFLQMSAGQESRLESLGSVYLLYS